MTTAFAPRPTAVVRHDAATFAYTPPPAAHDARLVVVKPNLGYPVGPPATVSTPVLAAVLAGLRAVAPTAEIVVLEGVCSKASLAEIAELRQLRRIFDAGMRLADADAEPLATFAVPDQARTRFRTFEAPALLQTADCRISVGACKRTVLNGVPLFSGATKNLYGLLPRRVYQARSPHSRGQLHRPSVPRVLEDLWCAVGRLFDGAVVDAAQAYVHDDWHPDRQRGVSVPLGAVFTSDDLVAADDAAAEALGEAPPSYGAAIRARRGW